MESPRKEERKIEVASETGIKRPIILDRHNIVIPLGVVIVLFGVGINVGITWNKMTTGMERLQETSISQTKEITRQTVKIELVNAKVDYFRRAAELKLGPLPDFKPAVGKDVKDGTGKRRRAHLSDHQARGQDSRRYRVAGSSD